MPHLDEFCSYRHYNMLRVALRDSTHIEMSITAKFLRFAPQPSLWSGTKLPTHAVRRPLFIATQRTTSPVVVGQINTQ